ncbi:MAG: sigma-70 family RNA polymerase sigma factor, partial [Chloroflexi bacterium]|nr:sigma-70 family RNA polymerase sigma factor [Chloroflexota bacterium]
MPREDGIVSRPGAPGAERVYLTLVAEHQTAILNYLYRLVGDADAAEDLTQETYVKAWRALERLELDEDAEARRRAWLYRIAHNAALDHLRRKTRFRWLGLDALRGGSGDPAARSVPAAPVRQALDRLEAEQRQLLLLFNHEGLNAAEVAEVLGITPAAARKRRQRASEAFREIYTALEAVPPRGADEDRATGDDDRDDDDRDRHGPGDGGPDAGDSSGRERPADGVGRAAAGADPRPEPGGAATAVNCERCRALLAEAPIEALTPEDRGRVEAHASGCPDCHEWVETDRLLGAGFALERRLSPSRSLQRTLLEIPRRDRRQRLLMPLVLPLAMAFCALSSWLIWSLAPEPGQQAAVGPDANPAAATRPVDLLGPAPSGGPGQVPMPESGTAAPGAASGAGATTSPRANAGARGPLATLAAAILGRP